MFRILFRKQRVAQRLQNRRFVLFALCVPFLRHFPQLAVWVMNSWKKDKEILMKVLVTGFEPFGPWQRNPSGETARHLDGATIVDVEISGLVLPVSFQRAATPVIAAIDELRPDVVLNLGQGSVVGVRVERIAVNR